MSTGPAPETAPAPTFTAADVASLRDQFPTGEADITTDPGKLPGSIGFVQVQRAGETLCITPATIGVRWWYYPAAKDGAPREELVGTSANLIDALHDARELHANPDRPRTT